VKARCPECLEPLRPELSPACREAVGCANGHRFACREGVWQLCTAGFQQQLNDYLWHFEKYRADQGLPLRDAELYKELPFGPAAKNDASWRMKQHDWALIRQLLAGRDGLRLLDVGAWNGWLSYRLTLAGHEVVAMDYFIDPFDGLAAKKHYPVSSWTAVQADLERLELLDDHFDGIIVNRGLPYFTDYPKVLKILQHRLHPGGMLLLTGLNIAQNPEGEKAQQEAFHRSISRQYDFPLFFKQAPKVLDRSDVVYLKNAGFRIRRYPALRWATWKNRLLGKKYAYCHALWKR